MADKKDKEAIISGAMFDEAAATPETLDDGAGAPAEGDPAGAAAEAATPDVADSDTPARAGRFDRLMQEEGGVRKLTGMYKNWFLDYASYVIL